MDETLLYGMRMWLQAAVRLEWEGRYNLAKVAGQMAESYLEAFLCLEAHHA